MSITLTSDELRGPKVVSLSPAPYVTIEFAAGIIGLSAKAIRRKIEDGVWLDGREYRRAPDGRIYVSIKGFTEWVEAAQV